MFNGDQGRLELEVVESSHRTPMNKGGETSGATHGEKALPNEGHKKITLQQLWKTKEDVPFVEGTGGHGTCISAVRTWWRVTSADGRVGGGDDAMLDQIFGPRPGHEEKTNAATRLGANQIDGALAMAVGLAANESFKTGKLVSIEELLGVKL